MWYDDDRKQLNLITHTIDKETVDISISKGQNLALEKYAAPTVIRWLSLCNYRI